MRYSIYNVWVASFAKYEHLHNYNYYDYNISELQYFATQPLITIANTEGGKIVCAHIHIRKK